MDNMQTIREWWNVEGRTDNGDYDEGDFYGTRKEAIEQFKAAGSVFVKIRPSHPNTIARKEKKAGII